MSEESRLIELSKSFRQVRLANGESEQSLAHLPTWRLFQWMVDYPQAAIELLVNIDAIREQCEADESRG